MSACVDVVIVWVDLQFLLFLKSYTHSFEYYQSTNAHGFCTHFEQEGCLQDVGGHIIYSPLHCHIPLPGFESLRFCISQYEAKDRLLLRNLCFTLGAKFTERLSKKVTHLLCKFTSGPKYEAACNWGIQSVTADWIAECIKQVYLCTLW